MLYKDGTEELYDLEEDPLEWNNLAGSSAAVEAKQRLAKHVPTTFADQLPSSDSRKHKQVKTLDRGLKSRRDLTKLK